MSRGPGALSPLKMFEYVLLACGGFALVYAAFFFIDAHRYERAAFSRLDTQSRGFAKGRSVSQPFIPPDDAPFARLDIPRLNLSAVVIQGDTDEDLRHGLGHVPGTALPGATGNVGIAGHRDTVFRPLRNIKTGDVIGVTMNGHTYRYRVTSMEIVAPDRGDVLNATNTPNLTLVTCYPFYYVGSAPKRFIVHSQEISP